MADRVTETEDTIDVRLTSIRFGARDTNLYEFSRMAGGRLPPAVAGSHVDLHLPGGLVRQYSLIQPDDAPTAYLLGVKKDPQSRGGSSFLHDKARVGDMFRISPPRNNFPLVEDAPHVLLIGGGIGITPIWCMWQRLNLLGRSVTLVYACRSRADAVFLAELDGEDGVTFHFDDENAGSVLDIEALLGRMPAGTHAFCCGPAPMLKAFEGAAASWPSDRVHVEYFTAQAEAATAGGFTIGLARSGKEVVVSPGETILAALVRAGIDAPYSCEEGVCGACMTTVLDGLPDHRDSVLTAEERAKNTKIMICCSGSKTNRLILDL
ncbi:PDR/VanB family oxidoreductase [Bradyrhizobium sp. NP1]|uniref:PDR/VanB family oxidoreductase n=1 Tax=Bradyrhizobium sp. NP1 TaxID=3049772 RepID=UPI0025A5312A|nr:PDR/VanB family oxidoreductase [Bradyrhizobium sp. NP1]WJR76846.1 PDR/VanB family oxidoreductase [Bradyrhizobium sp. NP1]